ncbi:S1 family peptidase [Mycobacterium sp. Aquia_213]|uniref:S1 family peptidase n=1 Tax=Mycobacterium sp. Aquia_213 TaxID=2991728 RepID=UPI00226E558B|nr:S1 family peptidase [Mycobacterium sp. Aquia_213]WAC92202.1 S1 family peptidase [Mycobacterium sp. Aquia_213]
MVIARLQGLGLSVALMAAATMFANTAAAEAPPTPGVQLEDESGKCTAGFAAQGDDGSYYLLTSGHCDAHDGSTWTYGASVPLGTITASEKEGDKRDAAIIRLNPAVGVPTGGVGGLMVRDVLGSSQLKVGTPFCKLGAVTGETCGTITSIDGDVVEASVFSLGGDSGSPGYVKNDDGSVSAVGILMSSPEGDDNTTYFTLVQPLLGKWGIHLLP